MVWPRHRILEGDWAAQVQRCVFDQSFSRSPPFCLAGVLLPGPPMPASAGRTGWRLRTSAPSAHDRQALSLSLLHCHSQEPEQTRTKINVVKKQSAAKIKNKKSEQISDLFDTRKCNYPNGPAHALQCMCFDALNACLLLRTRHFGSRSDLRSTHFDMLLRHR